MKDPEQNRWIECAHLTCFRSEFSFLAVILRYSGIRLHQAKSLEEADFLLTVSSATVFLSDVTFVDGTWRDALSMANEMHPRVASLIVADRVELPYLADAHELGACGVLWKPWDYLHTIEMIQAAHQASRDRATWLAEAPAAKLLSLA